jgi:hypothetical protein
VTAVDAIHVPATIDPPRPAAKVGLPKPAPRVVLPKDAAIRAIVSVVRNVVPTVEAVVNAAADVMIAAMMLADIHLATKALRAVDLAKA